MSKATLLASSAPSRLHIDYVRPRLYRKQLEAIFNCQDIDGNPARYALIEASTKAGKTVGCLAWLLEQAVRHGADGRVFGWIAPVYAQTQIAFDRMKRMLKDVAYCSVNNSTLSITLPNGAILRFRSGEKPDNLYGDDLYAAVIDEASRLREEAWNAVRSTLTATEAQIRIIGNVKGRRNWFYRLARRAEAGEKGMAYAKITATDAVKAGVLKQQEIDDARSVLPEHVFKELYEAEPGDDQGNPFGIAHIAKCIDNELSEERTVACGVDLGKKVNFTVIIGLDKTGHCTGFERFRESWRETKALVLETIGHFPTLIDATGVGDPIVEELSALRSTIEGFVFTGRSKQQLLEGLAGAIQDGAIRFPDGPIRQELETFEYENTRTGIRFFAPDGFHDDCVMALALAWAMHKREAPSYNHLGPGSIERESPWRASDGE